MRKFESLSLYVCLSLTLSECVYACACACLCVVLGMKTQTLNILTLSLRNTAEDKIEMLAQKRTVRNGVLVSPLGIMGYFQIFRVSGELQTSL